MPKTVERGQHFGIKYEILFAGGSWRDVTSHVDSRQTKVTLLGCTADLKGGISTMTVELRYGGTKTARASHSSLVGQLLQAKADLETVHFRASGLIEFVGKIDLSGFSQTNSIIPGFVTATVEDMSYLLDEKMTTFEYPTGTDLEETGWAVFDPLNPNISIVTQRILAAGYKLTDIDTEASDTIGERVRRAVGGDDDRTYRDFLNILLYEYCAVLYCDGRGKFVVRRLYQSAPVAGREVTEFLATDGIQTKGTDYQFDGEQVVWSTLATRNNPVYVANISVDYDQSGPIKGDEVLPEDYWPTDGDIEETWQEFDASFLDRPYLTKESRKKNKDLSIISVKNLKAETHFDVPADFLLANNPPTIEPRRARFLYYNQNKTETRNVYGFQLSGDVLYRQKLNETTYPADSKKTADKFETEFVFDALAAERLANHLFRFRKNGDIAHVWSEIRSAVPPLFEVVNVAAPDTLISTLGMVLSQDITIPAPNKVRTTFTSVSITAFNSEPARTRSVVLGSPAVEPGRDGTSGDKAVVQYALGTADAPYSDASVLLGTADTLVGTDLALVGVDKSNTWQSSPPTPAEGEYVWRREGWYTPPALWPSLWNVTRLTGSDGKDAEKIELTKSPENVVVSARGWMKQRYITIQAVLHNIDGTITWSCSDGTLTPVELEPGVVDNTRVVLDGATMTGTSATVIATVTFEGTIYTAPLSIDRIITGDTKAYNFGGFGGTYEADGALNPVELPDGDLLTKGDYFMWVHDTVNKDHATNERLKGEIYEYTGSEWMRSTNGDLVMTMFDTFAELENDYDSAVLGYAVIKKLVAIEAFIENLKAVNVTAGYGDGSTGGFRFRAMSDRDMDGGNIPIFDVMYDNKKLFEVVATGTDAGDVIIGDYANGNGIKYDKSANKLLVNGTVEAGSVVPVFNIRNGLGQDGNNNNFSAFAYTTTLGYFPEGTKGSFGVSGSTSRDHLMNDDFIQVDTTKAYTFDMWAKAQHGLATTNHYLFYACYDADKNFIPYPTGGTYNYVAIGNLSSTWTKYSTVINGVADGYSPTKFRPGTRFIKVGCRFNYSEDAYHELYIAGITLREATPFSVDGTAFQTANGKVKIHNDGTIEAVDGIFSGDIWAKSGYFKGIFDTTALKLEPGGANVLSKYVGDNYNQALDLYDYFVTSQGLSEDTYHRINSPTSGTYTFSSEYPPLDFSKVKYVRFTRSYVYRNVIFYDYTYTDIGRVRKRIDGSTTAQVKLNASITLAVVYGGDKLIVSSDIPINTDGLDDYQVYLSGDTLKVKLP